MADASYQPAVYRKQGSTELVVASGGKVTIESGGQLEVVGVDVVDELNALGDVGLTTGELNYLDAVTAGTVTASKAVVVGGNKQIDVLAVAVGGLALGTSTANAITADHNEINVLDGVTAGTVTASKAVVVGTNKQLDVLAIAVGGLAFGTSTSNAVTADHNEINVLDGVTGGTVTASKAVVVGGNKQLDVLAIASGGLCIGTSTANPVTADAAELNALDAVVAGTASASKAAVLGTNKELDVLAVAVGGLCLGTSTANPITADAAELNYNDGVTPGTVAASKTVMVGTDKQLDVLAIALGGLCVGTSTASAVTGSAADLNVWDGKLASLTWTVGAESSETRALSAQAKDADGANLNGPLVLKFGLFQDSSGAVWATSTQATLTTSTGAGGLVFRESTTSPLWTSIASSSGVFGFTYTDTATGAAFIAGMLPTGVLSFGGALAMSSSSN